MSDNHDLGEAAAYICGERPRIPEEHVWAVLNEVHDVPATGADGLVTDLMAQTHPEVSAATVRSILSEWRAYAVLADSPDWDDLDD